MNLVTNLKEAPFHEIEKKNILFHELSHAL